jgi:hypothetical protein
MHTNCEGKPEKVRTSPVCRILRKAISRYKKHGEVRTFSDLLFSGSFLEAEYLFGSYVSGKQKKDFRGW